MLAGIRKKQKSGWPCLVSGVLQDGNKTDKAQQNSVQLKSGPPKRAALGIALMFWSSVAMDFSMDWLPGWQNSCRCDGRELSVRFSDAASSSVEIGRCVQWDRPLRNVTGFPIRRATARLFRLPVNRESLSGTCAGFAPRDRPAPAADGGGERSDSVAAGPPENSGVGPLCNHGIPSAASDALAWPAITGCLRDSPTTTGRTAVLCSRWRVARLQSVAWACCPTVESGTLRGLEDGCDQAGLGTRSDWIRSGGVTSRVSEPRSAQ